MTITSRSNPLISDVCALKEKKGRDESGLFFFEGRKLLEEALRSPSLSLVNLFLTEKAQKTLSLPFPKEKVVTVSEAVAEKLTLVSTHDGIFCTAEKEKSLHLPLSPEEISGTSALFLSSVRDPGNLGTVLRTAYAFGIGQVILSPDCADLYNPKTVRAAMGMVFRQKVLFAGDETKALTLLRESGFGVYATALSDSSLPLGSVDCSKKTCFVLGNEGHGLSEKVIAACGGQIIIPMMPSAESLNVSSAATVLAWELFKAQSGQIHRG